MRVTNAVSLGEPRQTHCLDGCSLAGAQLARPWAEAGTASAETHAGVEPGERGAKVAGTHTEILAVVVPTPGEGEWGAGRCRGGRGSSTPAGQMWRLSQPAKEAAC